MRPSTARSLAILAFLAAACAGCGGRGPAPSTNEPPAPAIDPATTGRIEGTIRYTGPDPAPLSVDLSADPHCEKAPPGVDHTPEIVLGPERTLGNAVVWIEQGAPAGRYPVPSASAVLAQKGCWYEPRVQAVLVGRTLEIRNEDATMHNVHVLAEQNRAWNRSQIEGAVPIEERLDHAEVPVTFRCNVHPWMKAQVAVLPNPFFAVTSTDGRFEIPGLPAGEYTVAVWHETLGKIEKKVTVAAKDAVTVDFALPQGGA
jgi:plastocyanin